MLWGLPYQESHRQAWAAAPVVGAEGAKVYEQRCAQCHNGQVARAPKFEFLKVRTPEAILDSLENGVMKFIGLAMSDPDRKAVSEFIAGKPITGEDVLKDTTSNLCPQAPGQFTPSDKDPQWNGWGVTLDNARFQPTEHAGLKPNRYQTSSSNGRLALPPILLLRNLLSSAGVSLSARCAGKSIRSMPEYWMCVLGEKNPCGHA